MARTQATDFLQGFRYFVRAVRADGSQVLQPAGRPDAGFSAVGSPRLSIENASYQEGQMLYARKQPGAPSFEDITMSRGIARGDTTFFDWAQQTAEGSGEYRVDLTVEVFHRAQALSRTAGDSRTTLTISTDRPAVTIFVLEAFPNGVPLFGDLDANSSEIAVQELGITYEHAYTQHHPAT